MNITTMTDDEAYAYICQNLPSYDQREAIRYSRPFKNFTTTWCKGFFNSKKRVGSLMSNIATLPETASRADWTCLFFQKNLSPAGILKEVERLSAFGRIDFNTALTYWWIHLQDSVYTGWKDEVTVGVMLREYAQSRGLATRTATDFEDRNYCVDVIVYDPNNDDRIVLGVQIKGEKYFTSTREHTVEARETIDPPKYLAFTEVYGVEVMYAVIEPTIKRQSVAWKRANCYN